MHNRVGRSVSSYDIGLLDGAVLGPLIAVVLFLALYPQFALQRSEGSVGAAVAGARRLSSQPRGEPAPFAVVSSAPGECRSGGRPLGCPSLRSVAASR